METVINNSLEAYEPRYSKSMYKKVRADMPLGFIRVNVKYASPIELYIYSNNSGEPLSKCLLNSLAGIAASVNMPENFTKRHWEILND